MSITGTQDFTRVIEAAPPPPLPSIGGFQQFTRALGTSGDTIQRVLSGAPTGLVGTLTVAITSYDGSVTIAFPTTQGIAEIPEGSGRYVATLLKPDVGRYWIAWAYPGVTIEPVLLTISRDGALEMRSGIGAALGS